MQSHPFESGGPQQTSKMAIPRLDRGQPPRSFKSTGKTKEERVYDAQAEVKKNYLLTSSAGAARVKCAESEVCVLRITPLIHLVAYQATEIRCSGETPSCSNCQLISADCVYEASRRDRLKECVYYQLHLVPYIELYQGHRA
jgi:hypothetical protein